MSLDMQYYVELALGVIALVTVFSSLLRRFHGYAVYTLIAGVSIIYADTLPIHHAPKAGERGRNRKESALKW